MRGAGKREGGKGELVALAGRGKAGAGAEWGRQYGRAETPTTSFNAACRCCRSPRDQRQRGVEEKRTERTVWRKPVSTLREINASDWQRHEMLLLKTLNVK